MISEAPQGTIKWMVRGIMNYRNWIIFELFVNKSAIKCQYGHIHVIKAFMY